MNGEEAVSRICDQLRKGGTNPDAATVLSFVTWEEIVRVVVTSAGEAGVLEVEWPESAPPSSLRPSTED